MKGIPDGAIDAIIADLPYGTTNCKWDSVISFEPMWSQMLRITRQDSPIILFAAAPFDKALASSNLKMFRYEWIWQRTHTNHLNAKKQPLFEHEHVLVFAKPKSKTTYNPQLTSGHKLRTVKAAKRKAKHVEVWDKNLEFPDYSSTDRYPRSILKYPSVRGKNALHPTQKPVELVEFLIKTYTNEGDLVLDNCIGSGTTAIAAINTGRNFIGIEKDEQYFEIAKSRIEKHLKEKGGSE